MGDFEMEQSIDFSISNKDSITLAGSVNTHGLDKQGGGGSLGLTFTRLLSSDAYLNFTGFVGAKHGVYFSAYKGFTKKCNATLNAHFKYVGDSVVPSLNSLVRYQLDKNLVGQLEFKFDVGLQSSLATSLIYTNYGVDLSLRLRLSLRNTFASININKEFSDYDLKLKTYFKYGFFGATFSYGIEKQLTKYSRIDASMMLNSLTGVILNISIQRGAQTLMAPIHLSTSILPSAVFYGTLGPLAIFYVVKIYVLY